jgi:diguanylate cyclase (GGDEF)-like protein
MNIHAIKISKATSIRLLIAMSSMLLYALIFLVIYPLLGLGAGGLNIIPAAVFGWLMGVQGGFFYLLIAVPINVLLYSMVKSPCNELTTHFLGISLFTLVSVGLGWIRDTRHINTRMRTQAAELEAERKLLQEEIIRRTRAEEKLAHEALHDPLTDLPNRRLLFNRLEHAFAWNKRNPENLCAVLYLDLDGFKEVNDSLGHEAGDNLLKQVAGRLQASVRDMDTVARMGGDEFAILLEAASNEECVKAIVQRIQASLVRPYELPGNTVEAGASIGVVMNIAGYDQFDHILRDADTAMYKSKANGRNQYRVFDVEMRK